MAGAEHINGDADEVEHDSRHVEHVVGPVAPAGEESVEVAEDFFGPEVDAAFAGIAMGELDDGDALRPEKRRSEMIQSQMVTPPLAAIEGTTLRLKTATTKRRTRSRRPRARIRWGWAAGWVAVDKALYGRLASLGGQPRRLSLRGPCRCGADECVRPYMV